MNIIEASKFMAILEDCFPLDLKAQKILVERLRSDFPEFCWDKIQQMPMIIMVNWKGT